MDNHFLPIEPKKDTSITTKRQIERSVVSKAIYMVTDLFEEGEPLKLALRNAAVNILKDKDVYNTEKLKSLLILSREVGFISTTNVDILIKAINSIEGEARVATKDVDLAGVLSDVLQISDDASISNNEVQDKEVSHNRDSQVIIETNTPEEPSLTVTQINKTQIDVSMKKSEKQTQTVSMSTTLDIGTRRKKILEVVRSKGQATIHEFIQSIQGCSSKTIQRELTSLVLSGTLKKTGERRWSKYSLR